MNVSHLRRVSPIEFGTLTEETTRLADAVTNKDLFQTW
jgi:hypothetical protein